MAKIHHPMVYTSPWSVVAIIYNRLFAFSQGPGGFRELRDPGRNHSHLAWYLSDTVSTSEVVFRYLSNKGNIAKT